MPSSLCATPAGRPARWPAVRWWAAALALALHAGCGGEEPAAAPRPAPLAGTDVRDVLLITVDTLRYDALGFTGNPRAATPVLDRLAAGGRSFRQARAHNVVTLPSHANILTGRYPFEHGVRENSGFVLGPEVPTLATLLSAAGWATAAFVGAYPLDSRFGLDRGFDVYDDRYPKGSRPDAFVIAERRGDEVVAPALAWWRAHAGEKRFLWVHLYDPHAPYEPVEPFAGRFAGEPYLGEVAAVDSYLGPLLAPILADDSGEPTLVVFTADHGEALGEHGELTHGLFAYEATLRVPLVLWGPGVEPGIDDRPVGHVDLAPTVLAAAGVTPPPGLPGRPLLGDAGPPPDRVLYFEAVSTFLNRGWAPLRGALQGGWKWIELPLPELYHLPEDAAEEHNRFDAERRQAALLARQLPGDGTWPPERTQTVSTEEAARLRALGYVTGSGGTGKSRFTAEDDPKNLVAVDRKIRRVMELYGRGDLPAAAAVAAELVEERPTMPEGYQHLALILRQLERPAEAVRVLETALARGLTQRTLVHDLGLTLAENGRAAEAVAILEPLAGEDDLETLVALGNAYFAAGRLEPARQTMERVLALDEANVEALEGLAAAALAAGRPDVASAHLERALALNEALPISWNSLGVARYQLGDPQGAMAAWERAAALDPRQFDALVNLGRVAAERGERERARRALARFVETAPRQRYAADLAAARRLLEELGK